MPVEINGRLNPCRAKGVGLEFDVSIDISNIQNEIRLHDEAGFDRMVVGEYPNGPDALTLAAYVSALSPRLGVMLEHPCGVVVPTMAARKFATLDRLLGGKLALHILNISGDAERKIAQDFASQADIDAHAAEFIDILRNIWSSDQPIDFAGKYYRFNGGYSEVKPVQGGDIPIFYAGDAPSSRSMMAVQLRLVGAAEDMGEQAAQVIAGDADQIVDQLMAHYANGVSIFTLSAEGAPENIAHMGRDILPALRARVLQYDAERGIA